MHNLCVMVVLYLRQNNDIILGCIVTTPGLFTGPTAFIDCTTAIANNTAPCDFIDPEGCEDCSINLASSLNGPMMYMGIWDATQNYQIDECISIQPTLFDLNCSDKIVVTNPPYPQAQFPMGAPSAVELLFSLPSIPTLQGAAFAQYKFEVGPAFGGICKGPNNQGLAYVKHISINSGPLVDPFSSLYQATLVGAQMVSWSDLMGTLNMHNIRPFTWWVPIGGWTLGLTSANNGGYPHDYVTIHDFFLGVNTYPNGTSHDWTVHWEYCKCESLECCYCCIQECPTEPCPAGWSWNSVDCKCDPPIIHSLTSQKLNKAPNNNQSSASLCNAGYFPPEHLNVTLPNSAHWEACNINVDNTPQNCEQTPVDVCQDDCYTHLHQYMYYPSNGSQQNLIFKPWSMYYHYGVGMCVTDPNDGCCYCCVTSPTPGSPNENGTWTQDPTSNLQPCSLYGGTYYGSTDQNGDYFGWMSCTASGIVPCTGINSQMWGCVGAGTGGNGACVVITGGQYTSQTDCYLYSNCEEEPKGFFICKSGLPNLTSDSNQSVNKKATLTSQNPCNCVFDLFATSGYVTYGACAGDPSTCCKCDPPPQGCPPGQSWNQNNCNCELPSIMSSTNKSGDMTPCIQTEDCDRGWNWDWEVCKCISGNQSGSGNAGTY